LTLVHLSTSASSKGPQSLKRRAVALLAVFIATFHPTPAIAGHHGWAKASSAGRDLLVAAALGLPAAQGDWHGDLEAGGSMLVAGGTTYALKELVHERRPDGSDDRSFPSGHTSVSFAAAATLEKRYGWKSGLPAVAVASFVGLARVEADKHYVHDVLAGAAIGSVSGFLLTGRYDDRVQLVPWAARHGGGFDMAWRF
jgi:membrane-associated phospholipid phosphatase